MLTKFLDPKNDIAFKRIFGSEKNKDILIGFKQEMDYEATMDQKYDNGLAKGLEKGKKEIITKMLAKGKSLEEIADMLDVSIEEVRSLS